MLKKIHDHFLICMICDMKVLINYTC